MAAADLDLDGDLDLVVAEASEGRLAVLLNDGSTAFRIEHTEARKDSMVRNVTASDLNGDGEMDFLITSGPFVELYLAGQAPPFSQDVNRDGIPDECQIVVRTSFHRADPTGDGREDLSDAVFILNHLFLGGQAPDCMESADADDNGNIDLTDAIMILTHLFLGGPRPADPGPPPEPCGPDPDTPGSPGDLGCLSYRPCHP